MSRTELAFNLPDIQVIKKAYQGSVKDLYKVQILSSQQEALLFCFSDSYSVFDWGRMPDQIPNKGLSLAKMGLAFFQLLESSGHHTHCLVQENLRLLNSEHPLLLVQPVDVYPPTLSAVGSQSYYSYLTPHPPHLIPLEVVFRFELIAGSSFLSRHPESPYKAGHVFEEPLVEFFTKLEPQDRALSLSEAQMMSGLSNQEFQQLYLRTLQTAKFLKDFFTKMEIRLIDGKLEWALDKTRNLILVDAIGPDELRLEFEGCQLSKEVLRLYYRQTQWFKEFEELKKKYPFAHKQDHAKWPQPANLPQELLFTVSQMYKTLAECAATPLLYQEHKVKLFQIVKNLKQFIG